MGTPYVREAVEDWLGYLGTERGLSANTLEAYARDPALRARHGDAGLAFAKTMDWDHINGAVMRVYQRVIERRKRMA